MQWSPQTFTCCVYEHARYLPSVSYKGYQKESAEGAPVSDISTTRVAAVFKESSEEGDNIRAAFITTLHLS